MSNCVTSLWQIIFVPGPDYVRLQAEAHEAAKALEATRVSEAAVAAELKTQESKNTIKAKLGAGIKYVVDAASAETDITRMACVCVMLHFIMSASLQPRRRMLRTLLVSRASSLSSTACIPPWIWSHTRPCSPQSYPASTRQLACLCIIEHF